MSYAQEYQQYGTNPYTNAPNLESGVGGPEYGTHLGQPPLHQEATNYSNTSNYSNSAVPAIPSENNVLSRDEFLNQHVKQTRDQIDEELIPSISEIATLHLRTLDSLDTNSPAQLENVVTKTQLKVRQIRDSIKYLDRDALRTTDPSLKSTKLTQIRYLKNTFEKALKSFQDVEVDYRQRYRAQIARQYQIVNPNASAEEVKEASEMDWGQEGVFQTALKSNRSGEATSALGTVRARHNEIQKIEATLTELASMFADMAQIVEAQDPVIEHTEQNAENTQNHVKEANVQIDKAKVSAARARRLKWWCLLIVVLIILVIALGVGLGVGLVKSK